MTTDFKTERETRLEAISLAQRESLIELADEVLGTLRIEVARGREGVRVVFASGAAF